MKMGKLIVVSVALGVVTIGSLIGYQEWVVRKGKIANYEQAKLDMQFYELTRTTFTDLIRVAEVTPRIGLASPVSKMQETRQLLETHKSQVPCATRTYDNLHSWIQNMSLGFVAFMADDQEKYKSAIDQAKTSLIGYEVVSNLCNKEIDAYLETLK